MSNFLFGMGAFLLLPATIVVSAMILIWWWKQTSVAHPPAQAQTPPAGATPPPAAPAPTPAPANRSWVLGWPSSPLVKFAGKGLAILVILLLVMKLMEGFIRKVGNRPIDLDPLGWAQKNALTEWQGVPYWLLAIVAAIAVAAIVFGDKKKLASLIATVVVIIFAMIVYLSYRDGWLMQGRWREVFYVLAIAFALLAYTYTITNKEKWGAAIVLGAIFAMLGFSQIYTWREFSSHFPEWAGGPPSGNRQVVSTPPRASGPPTGVTLTAVLGPNPIELNPGGSYHIRWDEVDTSQCVKIYDPSNRYVANDCNGDVDLKNVRAAKFASARGDLVRINYVLTPRWQ